ncbi:hypothetical protein V2I12_25855 [Peribacillus frigoritolerans]|nr:hypothetical protein [Peribacillus frigoritolerans]MEE3955262.1 hypothetical protein [Peribacillus frigoritolerans]
MTSAYLLAKQGVKAAFIEANDP